ncbi:MAG: DUF882 domain-containing protein [Desulfovibrionaceae bacterium]|nr:DUF882 domain-containing protein [Desulfovibrionaceae bacterium]
MSVYSHYSEYKGEWLWKNFKPYEVACKCCGELWLDPAGTSPSISMDALQELRELWERPIIINSGHRCKKHNRKVGGTENSQHLKIAFDIPCPPQEQARFINLAREAGFTGVGRYPRRGFVHLDLGPTREWMEKIK